MPVTAQTIKNSDKDNAVQDVTCFKLKQKMEVAHVIKDLK